MKAIHAITAGIIGGAAVAFVGQILEDTVEHGGVFGFFISTVCLSCYLLGLANGVAYRYMDE